MFSGRTCLCFFSRRKSKHAVGEAEPAQTGLFNFGYFFSSPNLDHSPSKHTQASLRLRILSNLCWLPLHTPYNFAYSLRLPYYLPTTRHTLRGKDFDKHSIPASEYDFSGMLEPAYPGSVCRHPVASRYRPKECCKSQPLVEGNTENLSVVFWTSPGRER